MQNGKCKFDVFEIKLHLHNIHFGHGTPKLWYAGLIILRDGMYTVFTQRICFEFIACSFLEWHS